MHWLRDYGALLAASVAAVVALANGWLAARRDQRDRVEGWLRELRVPRYSEFLRATDTLDHATWKEYGEWAPEMGPPPTTTTPPASEAWRQFREATANIALLGPPEVTRACESVQFSIWEYQAHLERDPFAGDAPSMERARNEFVSAAATALGIPFDPQSGHRRYSAWRDEQKALDDPEPD